MKKNIIVLLAAFLFIMLVPSTIYAYDFEGKDAWVKEYISTDEEAKVAGTLITLYADESLSEGQSYNLNKGDVIKIIQHLQLMNENSKMKVIVNGSQEGYISIVEFIEGSIKKSDSLLFKGYKKYINFIFGKDADKEKTIKIFVFY